MDLYLPRVISRVCSEILARAPRKAKSKRSERKVRVKQETLEPRTLFAVTPSLTGVPTWRAEGPFVIEGSPSAVGMGNQNNPVSAAIQRVVAHPTNPDVLFIGSVNGGIWKSSNATWSQNDALDNDNNGILNDLSENPTWKPVGEELVSLSISDLSFDPLDPTHNTLLASSGALSSTWQGGQNGVIYRSEDAGETWKQVSILPATPEGRRPVASMLATGVSADNTSPATQKATQILLAGTRSPLKTDGAIGGLFRSLDAGASWTFVSGSAGTGLPRGPVTSIVRDPAVPGRVFAAVSGVYATDDPTAPSVLDKGVYVSQDAGATWAPVNDGILNRGSSQRILLAAPANAGSNSSTTIFVGLISVEGALDAVYHSNNGGQDWTKLGTTPAINGGLNQGTLHFGISAHPTDPDLVYVTGDALPDGVSSSVFVGRISDGSWTGLTGTQANGTAPHTDGRSFSFSADGQHLYQSDDGGVFRLRDFQSPNRRWESLNRGLNITEVTYSVGWDPVNRVAVVGAQDNGSLYQTTAGSGVWTEFDGGDGGFQRVVVATNPNGTETSFRYLISNNFGSGGSANVSGTSWTLLSTYFTTGPNAGQLIQTRPVNLASPNSPNIVLSGIRNEDLSGFRRRPIAVNPENPKRVIFAGRELHQSEDFGDTVTDLDVPGADSEVVFSALATRYLGTQEIVYAAKGNSIFRGLKSPGKFHNWVEYEIPDANRINDIVIDPVDPNVAYAIDFGQQVFATVNQGKTWHPILGVLDGLGAHPRAIEVLSTGGNSRELVVGTDFGVWRANVSNLGNVVGAGAAVKWRRVAGIPNVQIKDLDYTPPLFDANNVRRTAPDGTPLGDVLAVGTGGRGVYTLENASVVLTTPTVLTLTGDAAPDSVVIDVDPSRPTLLRFSLNGVEQPALSLPLNSVDRIEFLGNGGADSFVVDGRVTLPGAAGAIKFDGGAGSDDVEVKGLVTRPDANATNGTYTAFGGSRLQSIEVENAETYATTPDPTALLNQLKAAIQGVGDYLDGESTKLLGQPIAGIGGTLGQALSGTQEYPRSVSSPKAGGQQPGWYYSDAGTSIFQRILAEGAKPLDLDQIGKSINSPGALRDALDALDTIPNNVVLTQTASGTRFNVQVQRRLVGESAIDVSALSGSITLAGKVRIGADVKLDLVFGIDDKGFYIDPNGSAAPELSISNIGSVSPILADGRFGFLGVGVKDGSITFDPTLTVALNLANPGIDPIFGGDDGVARPHEMFTGLFENATVDITSSSPQADAVLTGTFFVSAVLPNANAPFEIAQAKINLTWANVTDVTTLSLSVAPGAGSGAAQVIEFAKRGVSEMLSGLRSFAMTAKQLGKAGVLNEEIPLLGKSIGEIIEENPAPVVLTNAAGVSLLSVSTPAIENSARKFELVYTGINFAKLGISAEDEVEVKAVGGGTLIGRVEAIGLDRLILRFTTDTVAIPDAVNPSVTIKRRGGLDRQLDGVLSTLNNLAEVSIRIPTVQELIKALGDAIGVDPTTIPVSYDPATGSLIITPAITLTPQTYSRNLELASVIPGLQVNSSAKFDITVTPQLRIPIGMQIGGNAAWEDRLFLAADAQPEISLAVSAKLDDPTVSGQLGFLDLTVGEETPNQGIRLDTVVGVNLLSPTNDGKLRIKDLALPVGSYATTTIQGVLDVDALVLRPTAAGATLGTLRLELNNYTLNTLADLENLPAALANGITGNLASFEDFKNIGASAVIDALNKIAQRLTQLGLGGLANQPIPLINKSVSDLIDLGAEFAKKFGTTDGVDFGQIATAQGAEIFLEARLGVPVTVKIAPGSVIFDLDFTAIASKTVPVAFDLGLGKSIVGADAAGSLTLSASASLDLGIGISTADGVAAGDRAFLATAPGSELAVSVKANVGYDTTGDGIADAAPLIATVNGFGKKFGIINGRVLVDLTAAADLGGGPNNDNRLTFAEIASAAASGNFAGLVGTTYTGTTQALLPLDGNGDALVSYPAIPTGPDALVQIGGSIGSLVSSGLDIRTDPTGVAQLPRNANPATPLSPGQLDPSKFVLATYNLDGFVSQGLLNFGTLFDGLESFLDFGDDLLGINVLDFNIPILGKTPREVFDFFSSTGAGSIGGLVQTLKTQGAAAAGEQLTNETVYASALLLRNVLMNASGVFPIGDADFDGVVENNGDDLIRIDRTGMFSALVVNGPTFAQISPGKFRATSVGTNFGLKGVSYNNTIRYTANGLPLTGKITSVTPDFIEFTADTLQFAPDAGTPITIDVQTEIAGVTLLAKFKPLEYTKQLPFNLGLDFLDLEGQFDVAFKANLEVMLGAGISKTDGFFIVTDFSNVPLSGLTSSSPEISLNARVEITGTAGVTIGFLDLDGTFVTAQNGTAKNFLQAQLGINFNGLGDDRLTSADLTSGNISNILKLNSATDRGLQLNLLANLDIALAAKINSDLPGLSTHFVLNWSDPTDSTKPFDPVALQGVPTPYVALENVTLNAGSFLNKVASPIFAQLDKYNVLKPIIDVMDDELPIIGKSLYDLLIVPLPPAQKKTAEFLFQLSKTITETASLAAQGQALDFNFGTTVLLDPSNPNPITAAKGPPYPGQDLPLVGSYVTRLGDIGVTFPILDPTNLVQFIIGRDVDLVFVELEPIVVEKQFNVTIPLFSYGIPYVADVFVEAFFGGGFEFRVELSAGLDTRGLRAGKQFIDGFYIGDFDPGANGIIDPTDIDRPEVSLDANVFAGINAGVRLFGFPIGQVTGQGTIGAEIGINLNDDNSAPDGTPYDTRSVADRTDGKLHLDEISTILDGVGGNPLCLFDLTGKLYARLDITATVDLLFDKIQKSWGQEWTLLDFAASCVPVPPDLANLVLVSGKPVLELTSTTGGDPRLSAASNVADLLQINLVDKNGIAEDGGTVLALPAASVVVSPSASGYQVVSTNPAAQFKRRGLAEGQRVRYTTTGGQSVFGTVVIAQDDRFTLSTDAVNLVPAANTSFTVLSGKETLRVLKGHAQEDFGPAESGANKITDVSTITLIRHSGPLADFGLGDDIVTIDALIPADVSLGGGDGADRITTGSGGGKLLGGTGNDMLLAAPAPSDLTPAERAKRALRLEGNDGDDTLIGGPGDDVLLGGRGDDVLDAGGGQPSSDSLADPYAVNITTSGNDTLIGGAGDDALQGRDGSDVLVGDYHFTLDPRPASGRLEGKDAIDAGEGDDRVWGDNRDASLTADGAEPASSRKADDTIVGGTGDDSIFGGSGHDDINGEDGDDSLTGGSGNDLLQGLAGNDTIYGGYGNDALLGGEGDNNLYGGWHDDVIRGGSGNDYVEGGPGDDSICTFAGQDFVYGGTSLLSLSLLGPEPAIKKIVGGFFEYDCDSILIPNFVPSELTDELATVYGRVFNDLSADGIPDLGEAGLSNWTVQLLDSSNNVVATTKTTSIDLDGSGSIDPASEMGVYAFGEIPAGNFRVRVIAPAGWSPVAPAPPETDIEVTPGDALAGIDFAFTQNAPLTGYKFFDANTNGQRDPNEIGIPGIRIYLDLNDNGALDAGEPTAITQSDNPNTPENEAGLYTLPEVPPGQYKLRELVPALALPTTPNPVLVYANDFSSAPGSEWTTPASIPAPSGAGFLGAFGPGTTTLTLNDLPAHSHITVEFDLAIIGSWDGNLGSDAFLAAIRGQAPFLYATFAASEAGSQSWPLPNSASYASAFQFSQLGYAANPDGTPGDALYRIKYTLIHTSPQLLLDFSASGIEGISPGDDLVAESFRFFGDFDGDRDVDSADSSVFLAALNARSPDPRYDLRADFDADGDIDGIDYAQFRKRLNKSLPAPANPFVPTSSSNGPLVASLAFQQTIAKGAVTAVFSQDVAASLDVADLKVLNLATGTYLSPDVMALAYDSATRTATWTFPGLPNGGLADGNYRFVLSAASLSDDSGNPLNGNTNESFEAFGLDNVSISLVGTSQDITINGTNTADFGNALYGGTITGRLFADNNANGFRDPNEPFLPGVTLFADYNNNGSLDNGEPTTTTSVTDLGAYQFVGVANGLYTVKPLPGVGLNVTTPPATVEINTGRHFPLAPIGVTGRTTASVSGIVFNDFDSDGVLDQREVGIPNIRVFADLNGDNEWNQSQGEPGTLTGPAGTYNLTVTAGPVTIRWYDDAYLPTLPSDSTQNVTTTGPGTILSGVSFGTRPAFVSKGPASADPIKPPFHGFVFLDVNLNGIWDFAGPGAFEPRLDDWEITVFPAASTTGFPLFTRFTDSFDVNLNGTLEVPAELGSVAVYNSEISPLLSALEFELTVKEGYLATTPESVVVSRIPNQTAGFAFGVYIRPEADPTGNLSGVKYNDLNGNGTQDPGELGLEGVTIYIDANNNAQRDPTELTALTATDNPATLADEGGIYTFPNLPRGTYLLREVVPTDYIQTAPTGGPIPGAHLVTFEPGQSLPLAFGNIHVLKLPDGSDIINTGADHDTVLGDNATNFPAWVISTGAADYITSRAGDDTLSGQEGNDTILGGDGIDSLFGNDGDDLLDGDAGNDTLTGGQGNDTLIGGAGNDRALGGFGNDTYTFLDAASPTSDILIEDILSGTDAINLTALTTAVLLDLRGQTSVVTPNQTLILQSTGGFDGAQEFENAFGSLTAENALFGSDVNNLLVGGSLDDSIDAGDGNDTVIGALGSDLLLGGNDDDTLDGGLDADLLTGGDGNDTYLFFTHYGEDTVTELLNAGNDILDFSADTQSLSVFLDTIIYVNDDDNSLAASDNVETIRTGSGNDAFNVLGTTFKPLKLDGGTGRDRLDYAFFPGAVTANLTTGTATKTAGIQNFEDLIGSSSSSNSLTGNAGPNLIVGGSVNDTLTGAAGNDTLQGNAGNDTYLFADNFGIDTVTDTSGTDTLDLSAVTTFLVLQAPGSVSTGANSVAFSGIETIIGSSAGGVVVAKASGSNFALTAPGAGTVDTLAFSGFTQLSGSVALDTLTAIPTVAATYTLTADDTGTVTSAASSFTFAAIETLIGTPFADTFIVGTNGRSTGLIDGLDSTDTLDLSAVDTDVAVRLFNSTSTRIAAFASTEAFIAPASKFNLLTGPDASSVVNLTQANGGTIAWSDAGTPRSATFTNFHNITLRGGDDSVVFMPASSVTGTLDGGPGTDSLDYTNYNAPFVVNIPNNTATGTGAIKNFETFTPQTTLKNTRRKLSTGLGSLPPISPFNNSTTIRPGSELPNPTLLNKAPLEPTSKGLFPTEGPIITLD